MDRKLDLSFLLTSLSAGSNTTVETDAGHVGAPRMVVVQYPNHHHQGQQEPLGPLVHHGGMYASTGYEHGRLGGHDVVYNAMAAFAPGSVLHQAPSNATGYPYLQASFFPAGGVRDMAAGNTTYPASFVPGMGYPYQPWRPYGVLLPDPMSTTSAINPGVGSFTTVNRPGYATSASTGHELQLPDHSFQYYDHAMPRPAGHQWPSANAVHHHPSWASGCYNYGAAGSSSSSTTTTNGYYNYSQHHGDVHFSIPATGKASPSSTTEDGSCCSLHSSDDSFIAGVLDAAINIKPNNCKTRICTFWMKNNGHCPFGKTCSFAHGEAEQWTSSSAEAARQSGRYKTIMCRRWIRHGSCEYGKNCTYAHGAGEFAQGG